ncbi:MAG: tripartite tricarboxylate transporter substrate binding protein [Acidobacteria bacterium]|nr:tripartite tricarboxylate transporter substrate binding protein [Acidobacteriota bacterium]
MNLIKRILSAGLALGLACPAALAQQPAWPTKPVNIVVGYGAGGPGDIIARALATKLGAAWGQPVIVVNRPGANEILAATSVIKEPADGHTLILGTDALYSFNQLLKSKPGYDAAKDFAPITRVGQSPLGLFVKPDMPVKDLREFITFAKANPGKLTFASTGVGGITHLAVSWMSKLYGLDMVQVPYNAVPALMQDLSTGRTDLTMLAAGPLMPFVKSGKLRALAVAGPTRVAIAPDVPTFAESGYPEFESFFYMALAAPAGTPPAVVGKISADVITALKTDEMAKSLSDVGFQPVGETPAQFTAFLVKDRANAAERVKAAGVKME